MKFIKLTDADGRDTLVNFDKVESVGITPTKNTIIVFGTDDFLWVKESISDIEALIKQEEIT